MRIRPKAKLFELVDYNVRILAKTIGVSQCHIYRVKSGEESVNGKDIAGALTAFPEWKFEDLFCIERSIR